MNTKIDLHRYREQIDELIAGLAENPPAPGGVLLYGSSTMANWRGDGMCYRQLAPLPVSNTGFGGSTAEEALYYYQQLVVPVRPSVIAYYEGANDLNNGYEPEEILSMTHRLFEWCRQDFPGVKFIIVPVKLSPGLNVDFKKGKLCNQMFADYAAEYADTSIIDVAGFLYDEDGNDRLEIYVEDKLHHNEKGYLELAAILKAEIDTVYKG